MLEMEHPHTCGLKKGGHSCLGHLFLRNSSCSTPAPEHLSLLPSLTTLSHRADSSVVIRSLSVNNVGGLFGRLPIRQNLAGSTPENICVRDLTDALNPPKPDVA